MNRIDLHTHSNISDGSCAPQEVVRAAHAAGIRAMALTDHETIAGVAEAKAEAQKLDVELIMGMEMTVSYQNRRLHIVALGFDEQHAAFKAIYQKIRQSKESGMEKVIENIRQQGVPISMEILKPFIKGDKLDRYAIMRYFVSLRKYDDVQKIWDIHLNPALVGMSWNIPAEEGLAAIRAAGGINSLAHYHKRIGLQGLKREDQESALQELIHMGLDAMEAHYPNYSAEEEAFAAHLIEKYNLLPTGGTDFHGTNRPGVEIGTGINGNISLPYSMYERVLAKRG